MLLELVAVLAAAKLAAEAAQRLNVPTVVGEIAAGLIIGPTLLGAVTPNEVLDVLAELGAILLLVEAGMELDVAGLGAVGGRALAVAAIGVAAPLAGGYAAARALGADAHVALFAGAALTATSVGISARVLSEARLLPSRAGRTILGAAIADDLLGLVILTVVVRATGGHPTGALDVAGLVALALGVLLLLAALGVLVAPRLFDAARLRARVPGSFLGFVFVFVLIYSAAAGAARLAPILGAFVAGLCLGRTLHRDDIARELRPLSHLLVPLFFLSIGIHAELGRVLSPAAGALAGALIAVALAGKLASGLGVLGTGDGLLVGLGMLPRGEVGLIVTALGQRAGILDGATYGALVLTVVLTTLIAPPLLRLRVRRAGARRPTLPRARGGEVLRVAGGEVELVAEPPRAACLQAVLEAALAVARTHRPGAALLGWLDGLGGLPLRWDGRATDLLFELLRTGNPRAWNFLAHSGALERAVPELAGLLKHAGSGLVDPDPLRPFRWELLERLDALRKQPELAAHYAQLGDDRPLLLAAAALERAGPAAAVVLVRRLAKRLDLGAHAEEEAAALVRDHALLAAAARRPDALGEERILELAVHLRRAPRARALYLLTLASSDERAGATQLDELLRLVLEALRHEELTGREAANLVSRRRAQAAALVAHVPGAEAFVEQAPRRALLATPPAVLAAQAACLARAGGRARFEQAVDGHGRPLLVFAGPDRRGLLARTTALLARHSLQVASAWIDTWPNRMAAQAFALRAGGRFEPELLTRGLREMWRATLLSPPLPAARVSFDLATSPSYGLCRVETEGGPDALHCLAVAIAGARASIAWAHVTADGAGARFDLGLIGRHGDKPTSAEADAVSRCIRAGTRLERARPVAGPGARWSLRRPRSWTLRPGRAGAARRG